MTVPSVETHRRLDLRAMPFVAFVPFARDIPARVCGYCLSSHHARCSGRMTHGGFNVPCPCTHA